MTPLTALVADELALPVDPRVTAMAEAIAAQYGAAARAVLFYGSCLRAAQLDGQMLDFYLIVSDYAAAYPKRWLAAANRLIPPNVFPFAQGGLAAKYAVLSEADFARDCGPDATTVSAWARFAQPSRLVWGDPAAVIDSIVRAAPTLLALTPEGPILDRWRAGLARTYESELRAEGAARPDAIIDADPGRYVAFGEAANAAPRPDAEARWRRLRRHGKAASVARLAKASLTFAGGIDYLAWKINRHAGTRIVLKPWQRRHPLVAAIGLVPKLLRSGAIR
ncbi:MAG: hypothetical protein H0X36_01905 [Sphingomonadaceae bacterium]|nr:hypothetical protein [Sphingomonadaceae bacterium]